MIIYDEKLVKRWNNVMSDLCLEHLTINTDFSEIYTAQDYYGTKFGLTKDWMLYEAEYWLSCYYEVGNYRCDDRFIDEYCYKSWVSETGKLKRLIALIKKTEFNMIVEW